MDFSDVGNGNEITVSKGVSLDGFVRGNNNKLIICDVTAESNIRVECIGSDNLIIIKGGRFDGFQIQINGCNNTIDIGSSCVIKRAKIRIGNHIAAHDTSFIAAGNLTAEPGCQFLLFNSGSKVSFGYDCMLSTGITIRCGESPHLIFDSNGEYLDTDGDVKIGSHCWIGEGVYITKRACLSDNSVVAAKSVLTRKFKTENCVVAGNPARIAKRNISWVRNRKALESGDRRLVALDEFNSQFPFDKKNK